MVLETTLLPVCAPTTVVRTTPSVREILQFIEIRELLQQDVEAVEKVQAMQTFKENVEHLRVSASVWINLIQAPADSFKLVFLSQGWFD